MIKISLVKPIIEREKKIYTVHPLSLGYLATALRTRHSVSILDCENLGLDSSGFREYISRETPDLVGITVFSHNKRAVSKTIEIIRKSRPDTKIIIGGPHVNAMRTKILDDFPLADYAMHGEAEISLPLLADSLNDYKPEQLISIPGLIFRDSSGQIKVNDNTFIEDISGFDPMCYDLIGIENYFKGLPQGVFFRHKRLVSIITSRGCPFPCTFCAASVNNGKKIRYRNIANVINEIGLLVEKYGVREIHILDDNFTFSKEYAMSFCSELLKKHYRIDLALPNGIRLDKIDDELLTDMKKAGFYALSFGIESGSDETLKKIKKLETTEFITKQLHLVKKHGFRLTGTFIIGFPWESKEDVAKTLQFAKSLPLDHAAFGNFTPLPGTSITDELINTGELDESYEVPFTWGDITYSPKLINPEQLKKLQRSCVINFYFPSKIFMILRNIKFSNILFILRRALLLFK